MHIQTKVNEVKKIPKLRFSQFKDGWDEQKLGKILKVERGGSPRPIESFITNNDNGIHWIKIGDLKTGSRFVTDTAEKIKPEGVKKSREVYPGDFILSNSMSFGRPYIVKIHGCIHDGWLALRNVEKDKATDNFLYVLLQTETIRRKFLTLAAGSAVKNLKSETVQDTSISLPTIKEQQKIASFLTSVDDWIDNLRLQKVSLENYKKGMMQKLFSQKIRFKSEDGKNYPDWEERQLGELFNEVSERIGDRKIETYSITAGVGFVSQKEKWGKDISGTQNGRYIVLKPNQFSYNKGNSKTYKFGCVYLNNLTKEIAVPNVFISFELKDNKMSHDFFAKLFEAHYLDRGLRRIISSGARMDGLLNVSKHDFFKLRIVVPASVAEQTKIADFSESLDSKITLKTNQLKHSELWKKGLMQKMLI